MFNNIFTQFNKPALRVVLLLVIIGLCVLVNAYLAKQYLQQQVARQSEQMKVYQDTLSAVLNRYEYLPAVLRQDNELFRLALQAPEKASRKLKVIRDESGADEVYILNLDGETVASSNWGEPLSFVGKNYNFRPYYTEALQSVSGRGHFYGIGTMTNIPGYFVSSRYAPEGKVKAVLVVKVKLTAIETGWSPVDGLVLVSDRNGVIILSSDDDWRYKTLQPLIARQKQLIDTQRQFASEPLEALYIPDSMQGQHRVSIKGVEYIHTLDAATANDWQIHYLTPYASVVSQLYDFWSIALILLLAGLALALLIRTLNIRNALRHSQSESIKLRQLNQSLEHEIIERRQVETALRQTQADLRRSSKLAAMGQLSASITHELSQPLSAMKTYLASLSNQLKSNDDKPVSAQPPGRPQPLSTDPNKPEPDPHQQTLRKLTGLTERMITISQQLRYFARSGDKPTRLLDLKEVLQGALSTIQPAIQAAGIELVIAQPAHAIEVMAGRVRMEQVVVNLIRNALDAMQERTASSAPDTALTRHQLQITLEQHNEQAILSVADTGLGLPAAGRERLFEPFFSTKPSGVGMGLGLAISGNIVAELGGTLDAENREQGGANFTVTLPLYTAETAI